MSAANTYSIELSVPIEAPRDQVWQTLVGEINQWWRPEYHVANTPSTMAIESWLGGRLYEDCGGGNGLVWASVTAFEPPTRLILSGMVTPPFGGPANSLMTIILMTDGPERCVVHIINTLVGTVDEVDIQTKWNTLFSQGLKQYLEAKQPA